MIYQLQEKDIEDTVNSFIKYAKIDTQSKTDVPSTPSTQKQFDLAKILVSDLEALGLKPKLSDKCYVYCVIPGNSPASKTIGFMCHMDIAPDAPSENIKPILHKNISGDSITLPSGTVIPSEDLTAFKGQDIITSDGTTLLGADDKSGIAAVMQLATILVREGNKIPHGDIKLCFSPDEEVGHGTLSLDLTEFKPDIAYTIDGERKGEINVETFNAIRFDLKIEGKNVHPGYGYHKMINAGGIATEFVARLPQV